MANVGLLVLSSLAVVQAGVTTRAQRDSAPAQSAVMVLSPDLRTQSSATPWPFAVQPAGFCAVAEAPSGSEVPTPKSEFQLRRARARLMAAQNRDAETMRMGNPKGAVNNGFCLKMDWHGGVYVGNCHQYVPHGKGQCKLGNVLLSGQWEAGVLVDGNVTVFESPAHGSTQATIFHGRLNGNWPPTDAMPDAQSAINHNLIDYQSGEGFRQVGSDKVEMGIYERGTLKEGKRNTDAGWVQVRNFIEEPPALKYKGTAYQGGIRGGMPHGAGVLDDSDAGFEYKLSGMFDNGEFKEGGVELRSTHFSGGYDFVGYYGMGKPGVASSQYGDWLVHGYGHRRFRNGTQEDGGFIHGRLVSGLRRTGDHYEIILNNRRVSTVPENTEQGLFSSEARNYMFLTGTIALLFGATCRTLYRNYWLNQEFDAVVQGGLEQAAIALRMAGRLQQLEGQLQQLEGPVQTIVDAQMSRLLRLPNAQPIPAAVALLARLSDIPEAADELFIPDYMICSISMEFMTDPIFALEGYHTHEGYPLGVCMTER
ncbi:MAG: hypothetical protein O3A01_06495 [bacterium]|nr:hypothetical protein [bacterium]